MILPSFFEDTAILQCLKGPTGSKMKLGKKEYLFTFEKNYYMKSIVRLVVIMLAMLPAVSFAQSKKTGWPEMKTFHSFMSSTFHPSEEGDFKPLREKADSLLITAKAWKASTIPAGFKPVETKATLEELVRQCENIAGAVAAKAADEKLKVLISDAHDMFHKIVEKCRTEN